MNPFQIATLIILTAILAVQLVRMSKTLSRYTRERKAKFANIGEGTYDTGLFPMLGDQSNAPQTSSRYLLVKTSTDANHFTTTTTNDVPIGINQDVYDAANPDVPCNIAIIGAKAGTIRCVTDGTVANGAAVKCGTLGQCTAATTGDAGIFGRALITTDMSSAAGDIITIIPTVPFKYSF